MRVVLEGAHFFFPLAKPDGCSSNSEWHLCDAANKLPKMWQEAKAMRHPVLIKHGGAARALSPIEAVEGGGRVVGVESFNYRSWNSEVIGKQIHPAVWDMRYSNLPFASAMQKRQCFQNKTSEGVNWMRGATGMLITTCGSHFSLPVPPWKYLKALPWSQMEHLQSRMTLMCVCYHELVWNKPHN